MMRVVFMGTPEYATKILQGLLAAEGIEVVLLVTQPDKPVGRKQILTPPDTKRLIQRTHPQLEIFQPGTLRDPGSVAKIAAAKPDFIVVAAFGQILPPEVLKIAPCINLHASLLPRYRGASPIQSAILHRERYTGVTAMLMDEGLDTGAMLAWSYVPIQGEDAIALFDRLSEVAAELTPKVLRRFETLRPLPQNDAEASYAGKITKADGLVELEDAQEVEAKYRAFIFWPGIYLKSGLKLKRLVIEERERSHTPGEILMIEEEGVIVGCRRGSLRIERVQPPSKKEMSAAAYIRGKRMQVGDTLS